MSATDPIADMLTRLQNASRARHERVDVPGSRVKAAIADVLKQEGFIRSYKWLEEAFTRGAGHTKRRTLRIYLKFGQGRQPILSRAVRVSRPGRRRYVQTHAIPRILGGIGMAILSTPKGILSGAAARKAQVGGELLCYIS